MVAALAGNNRVLVTLNDAGEWVGLFYPYPGQFQHLRESRLGVYDVNARSFAWTRSGGSFLGTPRVESKDSGPTFRWEKSGLVLTVHDHVHPNHDLLVRVFEVRANPPRPLRLFAYQSFQVAESMYQDTAFVDTAAPSVTHYKRGYYFELFSDPPFTHAVCGEHTLKGLRGTYVDAEDGKLEGAPIAHGTPDSVIQWDINPPDDGVSQIRLFVAAGRSFADTRTIREFVLRGPARYVRESSAFWTSWTARRLPRVPAGLSGRVADVYRMSVLVMRHMTASNGSILASPDTTTLAASGDTYNYCWWRDGGYVAKAMDEAGLYEHAGRFLRFARQAQNPDGSFFHRHFADGAPGSTWHPPPFLQVDQTATVVASVWHHFKRGNDPDMLVEFWPMVKSAADFLSAFRDPETKLPRPSFDLWEERLGIHTYSTAAVAHALERAARIAAELGKSGDVWLRAAHEVHDAAVNHLWNPDTGRFLRSLEPRDERLDASTILALKLGLLPWNDPRARAVVDEIERRLGGRAGGGLARYEGDSYHGLENPWVICTLWLAEARLRLGERERCRELIEWVANHATPTLLLPEQVDASSGAPRSAVPLTWSHSTFVDVVHKFAEADGPEARSDD